MPVLRTSNLKASIDGDVKGAMREREIHTEAGQCWARSCQGCSSEEPGPDQEQRQDTGTHGPISFPYAVDFSFIRKQPVEFSRFGLASIT